MRLYRYGNQYKIQHIVEIAAWYCMRGVCGLHRGVHHMNWRKIDEIYNI